jgi:7,8-dihydroneopterin aldolase/epimerase/oxygenase
MSASTEIVLRGMRFHALVGILPHERTNAQPLEIDLIVSVSDGKDVVDYRRLYEATSGVIGAGHIEYLEDVADQVASRAFAVSERVTRARVSVRKPHVALGGPLDFAQVTVDRLRPAAGV